MNLHLMFIITERWHAIHAGIEKHIDNVEESEISEHFFGEQLEVAENSDSASQEQTIVT